MDRRTFLRAGVSTGLGLVLGTGLSTATEETDIRDEFPEEFNGFTELYYIPEYERVVWHRGRTRYGYTASNQPEYQTHIDILPMPFADTPAKARQVFARFSTETELSMGSEIVNRKVKYTLTHQDGWEYIIDRRYGTITRNGELVVDLPDSVENRAVRTSEIASEYIIEEMDF